MSSRPPRVFVSATTRDLKTAREGVFDVLTTLGVAAVEQTHFPPDHRTIRDMLRAKIEGCDAVVHIAGCVYGGAPDPAPDEPPRSYTQLEVEIADELGKPVYVFLTTSDFPFDEHDPEPAELARLQRDHCARLRTRPQKWEQVSNPHHLQARVAVTPFPGMRRFADPHKPANLPFDSLGTLFKGRDAFLVRLWKSLEAGGAKASALVAQQAIHGLGGVGKTRTAVEYALRFADRYRGLFYVTADSPLALTQNLAALCGPRVLNLPEQDDPNLSRQEAAALRWLATNPGWFLILDNVDTEDAASAVEKLLPGLGGGHVVITSRLSNWSGGVEPLELDVLDEAPASEFLLERTSGKRKATPDDASEVVALARDLGCLALALEQAGAFVVKHRCSLADYRARWRKQEAKVLEWYDARLMKYPRSVATTWQTSFDALGADGRGLLNVLAWLAPEPVPLIMLAKLGTPEGAAPIDVEAGCADLADYSLVKWDGNSNAVKAHRLVLDVTRYRTPEGERRGWLERALGMVNAFVVGDPLDVRTWKDVYDPASDHALAVTAHADGAAIPTPTARLMNRMGLYYHSRAEYTKAEPLFRRVLAIREASDGPDHPTTATALGILASLLIATDRHAEAEPLYARGIHIWFRFQQLTGHQHPNWNVGVNNYRLFLMNSLELSQEQAVARIREVLGLDAPTDTGGAS